MKLDFAWQDDGVRHDYCVHCHAEALQPVTEEGRQYVLCRACGQRHERALVVDPGITWWLAQDQEIWHESAGVFIRSPAATFLLFERRMFPFQLTVPAGHLDAGEEVLSAARREVHEETGLAGGKLREIGVENIVGDACRRGADAHRWHIFILSLESETPAVISEEGLAPRWITLEQALQADLTVPVRFVISKYRRQLLNI